MPRACQICNHPDRLSINKAIAEGRSKSLISREYGISTDSVSHHAEHHLSRQLVQAYEKKGLAESTDLLGRIDKILGRTEKIFTRNYNKNDMGGDTLALKALGEQRSTIELLAKISAYLHQARLLELQNSQDHFQEEQQALRQEGMARLNDEELECLYFLQRKMAGGDMEGVEVPAVFKAPVSPVTRPPLPPPLPRPKTAPTTVSNADYTDEQLDPSPTPGPDTEPEKPKGLPPQHVTVLKEASRAEQKRFVNELCGGGARR